MGTSTILSLMMVTRRSMLQLLAFVPALSRSLPGQDAAFSLLTTYVAGYRFYAGPVIEAFLRAGDFIPLRRDPGNQYDRNAVAIHAYGVRIGYIPRGVNAVPARLMDQGLLLGGRIVNVHPPAPPWRRVKVEIVALAKSGAGR